MQTINFPLQKLWTNIKNFLNSCCKITDLAVKKMGVGSYVIEQNVGRYVRRLLWFCMIFTCTYLHVNCKMVPYYGHLAVRSK